MRPRLDYTQVVNRTPVNGTAGYLGQTGNRFVTPYQRGGPQNDRQVPDADRQGLVVDCCFTATETVGLLGTGGQDGHHDFHTVPEL